MPGDGAELELNTQVCPGTSALGVSRRQPGKPQNFNSWVVLVCPQVPTLGPGLERGKSPIC